MLQGFQLIAEYPKGSRILEERYVNGCTVSRGLPQGIQVYYHDGTKDLIRGLRMVFSGHVGNEEARILLDSGAADAYIGKDLTERLGIACQGTEETVHMPDGGIRTVHGYASLKLHLQNFKDQLAFRIIDFGIPFDILLGDKFLQQYKVILNYGSDKASLWKLRKHFVVNSKRQDRPDVQETEEDTSVNIVSAMQAKRALHDCKTSFIGVCEACCRGAAPVVRLSHGTRTCQ